MIAFHEQSLGDGAAGLVQILRVVLHYLPLRRRKSASRTVAAVDLHFADLTVALRGQIRFVAQMWDVYTSAGGRHHDGVPLLERHQRTVDG